MCGCNKSVPQTVNTLVTPNPDCSYTTEQLNTYKTTLFCIKEKQLYLQTNSSETEINRFLGVVTSAIYYPTNYCYFQQTLEEISAFLVNTDLSNCNYAL